MFHNQILWIISEIERSLKQKIRDKFIFLNFIISSDFYLNILYFKSYL